MKSLLVVPKLPLTTRLKMQSFAASMHLACMLLVANPGAHGQVTNVDDTTSTPIPGAGHDYIKMLSETVNPANGSVSLRIQLPIPKGRGITPSFSIAYDSNSVNHLEPTTPGFAAWASNGNGTSGTPGGWSFAVPTLYYNSWQILAGESPNNYYCNAYSNYMFTDMGGGGHALGLATEYAMNLTCDGNNVGGWLRSR